MKRLIFCILVCILLLTACSDVLSPAGNWNLLSYGDINAPTPAANEARITFNNGTIAGNAGCNSIGGEYRIKSTKLNCSNLTSTLMACQDEAVMQQESAVLAGLNTAERFEIIGDRLVIYYDNEKQALTFHRAP